MIDLLIIIAIIILIPAALVSALFILGFGAAVIGGPALWVADKIHYARMRRRTRKRREQQS